MPQLLPLVISVVVFLLPIPLLGWLDSPKRRSADADN